MDVDGGDSTAVARLARGYGPAVVRAALGLNAVALSGILYLIGSSYWELHLNPLRFSLGHPLPPDLVMAALWVVCTLVNFAGYRWTFSREQEPPEPSMARVLRIGATFCVGSGATLLVVVAAFSALASMWCMAGLLLFTTIVLATTTGSYRLFVLSSVSFCSVAHLWIILICTIAATAGADR